MGLPTALGDPMYDPLYEEAQRLDVPLSVHGNRSSSAEVGAGALRTFAEVHCYTFPVGIFLHFTSIIFQGVPVRFPKLRLAFLEIGASWLPYWLDRMDEHWELRGEFEAPHLKKKPSEVVRESRVYFSLEAEERLLPQTIEYVGDDHFLYASDIPHWDGEFPKNLKVPVESSGPFAEDQGEDRLPQREGVFPTRSSSSAPAGRKANYEMVRFPCETMPKEQRD